MSANQKPIDAIRREMNRRGYDIGTDKNRRDIYDELGVSRKSSTKRLCSILGVEYNSHRIEAMEFFQPNKLFLIDIERPLDYIEFQSHKRLSREIMFNDKWCPKGFSDIIDNQFIVWYNERQYVISHIPHRELDPKHNFKYKMMFIRQTMKQRGYDVSYKN